MVEEKMTQAEMQFIQFISMLSNAAMQNLGKFTNPLTGKIEKSLEAARATIDLLSLLKEKTKGNLTKREEETLTDSLANLQLNYADEVKREEEKGAKAKPEGEAKKSS